MLGIISHQVSLKTFLLDPSFTHISVHTVHKNSSYILKSNVEISTKVL